MGSGNYSGKINDLVLNWKLRLIVSALFSIMGFAVLIATLSGYFMPHFEVLDQTIVGVAVCVVVIPVYLIIADLPKIDAQTIANLLNQSVPKLHNKAELILMDENEIGEQDAVHRREIEEFFENKNVYRFLPNRPIRQAVIIMISSLALTVGIHLYL